MKILNLQHGEGKTTALVKHMLKPGNEGVIYVAPTLAQADGARRMAITLGATDDAELRYRFKSAAQLPLQGRRSPVVVDELDGVLSVLFGTQVSLAAFTDDDGSAPSTWTARTIADYAMSREMRRSILAPEEFARQEEEFFKQVLP